MEEVQRKQNKGDEKRVVKGFLKGSRILRTFRTLGETRKVGRACCSKNLNQKWRKIKKNRADVATGGLPTIT